MATSKPRPAARPRLEYGPFTSTQAMVVRALVPKGRRLAIKPPESGRVLIPPQSELFLKYATFKRLLELGAIEKLPFGMDYEYYELSDKGRELWAEQCRIEGTPKYDPEID